MSNLGRKCQTAQLAATVYLQFVCAKRGQMRRVPNFEADCRSPGWPIARAASCMANVACGCMA